jgi:SAM-dependent methyltransferase
VTAREQRLVFGEVAQAYDDVRAGYPAAIGERIFGYAGARSPVLEVGAGTGKATAMLLAAGVPVTCVEPDPDMAAVLRARFGDRVRVELCGFEDWSPPAGGVPLICSAQAFHWVDPRVRWQRAYDALAPGGTLALFGHAYEVADADLERDLRVVHERIAPGLLPDPAQRPGTPQEDLFHVEMTGCVLFTDVTSTLVDSVVAYPRDRYLMLLDTYSAYRMLDAERRARLREAVGGVVDRHGGMVEVRLGTGLTMGRRAG